MSENAIEISQDNFEKITKENSKLIVDCWAPWCGPCRMMRPIIDNLAVKHAGNVVFGKLNVDDNPVISAKYGISAIPTLLLFKDGEFVTQSVGLMPENEIESWMKNYF